jgi:V/A-type H+-transporting ATPase subunit D
VAKLALNKTTLNREGRRLKAFRQFVPALDLKRKQLLAARQETRKQLDEQSLQLQTLQQQVEAQLPMLAGHDLQISHLMRVKTAEISYTNLVGLELPQLSVFELDLGHYSTLLLPHWVDDLVDLLKQALELEMRTQIAARKLEILDDGLQKTTQRLNLFDKVLIPEAQANIRKIHIALSDAERAGVVRAKIAKNKRRRMQL